MNAKHRIRVVSAVLQWGHLVIVSMHILRSVCFLGWFLVFDVAKLVLQDVCGVA